MKKAHTHPPALRYYRLLAGETQQETASAIGLTRFTYGLIESGKADMKVSHLYALSQRWGVPLVNLLVDLPEGAANRRMCPARRQNVNHGSQPTCTEEALCPTK
jgi:DNA-binding XRE family transcriptional regulator